MLATEGNSISYTENQKSMIPFEVQLLLPPIGLELYPLRVHAKANK